MMTKLEAANHNDLLEAILVEFAAIGSQLGELTKIDSSFAISSSNYYEKSQAEMMAMIAQMGHNSVNFWIHIQGRHQGCAYLSMSVTESEKVVAAAIGDSACEAVATALDDVLGEISNIVLNACLMGLAKNLQVSLEGGVPERIVATKISELISQSGCDRYDVVDITFQNATIGIEAHASLAFPVAARG